MGPFKAKQKQSSLSGNKVGQTTVDLKYPIFIRRGAESGHNADTNLVFGGDLKFEWENCASNNMVCDHECSTNASPGLSSCRLSSCCGCEEYEAMGRPKASEGRANEARASDGRATRVVWKPKDYAILCTFLEKRENFEMLHGSARQTSIGGNHPTKKSANSAAAALLIGMGVEGPLDGEAFMKKYQRYQAMYKKAKGFQTSTGSGLSEADIQKGITLPQKIEKTCPHFARADAIYGERANISPPAVIELGCGGNTQVGSEGDNLGFEGERGDEEDGDDVSDEDEESEVQAHEATCASVFVDGVYVHAGVLDSQVPNTPTEILDGDFDSLPTEILSDSEPVVTVAEDVDGEWMGFSPPSSEGNHNTQHAPPSTNIREGVAAEPTTIPASNRTRGMLNGTRGGGGSKRLQRKEGSAAQSVVNKPALKPNLVDMFGQKIAQKAKDQSLALASKERWKRAELQDKKDARLEEAKRARIERLSKAKLAKEANKYNLLIELAKLGRPIEEMKTIMDMSDML